VRLSATVTTKFFPLYHFSPLFFPLFFHLPQRFPLNTPPIPHNHYKISFSIPTINFLSTNNYSWTHSTVFRVMNSDTLDLGGERRGPTHRGRCRGHRCGHRVPLQPTCKGRGSGRVDRCGQSEKWGLRVPFRRTGRRPSQHVALSPPIASFATLPTRRVWMIGAGRRPAPCVRGLCFGRDKERNAASAGNRVESLRHGTGCVRTRAACQWPHLQFLAGFFLLLDK
jgi:hypothetical protein